jgi:hypothetical protein
LSTDWSHALCVCPAAFGPGGAVFAVNATLLPRHLSTVTLSGSGKQVSVLNVTVPLAPGMQ